MNLFITVEYYFLYMHFPFGFCFWILSIRHFLLFCNNRFFSLRSINFRIVNSFFFFMKMVKFCIFTIYNVIIVVFLLGIILNNNMIQVIHTKTTLVGFFPFFDHLCHRWLNVYTNIL